MFAPRWRARLLIGAAMEGLAALGLLLLMIRVLQRSSCFTPAGSVAGGNTENTPLINETRAGDQTRSQRQYHSNGAESYSYDSAGVRKPTRLEAGMVGKRFRSTRTLQAALCATAAARHWLFFSVMLLHSASTLALSVLYNGPLLLTIPAATTTLLWSMAVLGVGLRRLYCSLVWIHVLSWLLLLPAFGALGAHEGGFQVTLATSLFLSGLFSPVCHIQLPTDGSLPRDGPVGATAIVAGGALFVTAYAGSRTTRIDTPSTTTIVTHANSFSSWTSFSGTAIVAHCTAVPPASCSWLPGASTAPLYEVTSVTIETSKQRSGYRERNA